MSWGNRLLIVFIAFSGLISYMVYRCIQVPVELVSAEYYKDELAYQHIIDDSKRASALSKALFITNENNGVNIVFPPEMNGLPISGSIHFYCASDQKKDRRFKLNIDRGARWQVSSGSIPPGNYQVKIQWQANQVNYYSEQNFIQP
jgi:hypothetical protein